MIRRWPSIFLLLLIVLAAFFGWRRLRSSRSGIEALVPVVRESRIPLLLRLDSAIQTRGYPEDTDYHQPFIDAHRNYDDPGIPITLPLNGELLFPGLPVYDDAELSFGYGIEQVDGPRAVGARITFVISGRLERKPADRRELFRAELTCGPLGGPAQREIARVDLPADWLGESIALGLATECDRPMPEATALPVYLSPVLSSSGRKLRLERLQRTRTVVLEDLLDRYEQAVDEDEEHETIVHTTTNEFCFAVRKDADGSAHDPLPILTSGVTSSLDPDPRNKAARGGVRPALFFDWDHSIVRYPVEVPETGALLEFEIGVDHRCQGVGYAEFLVTIDGQEAFRRQLDPGRRPEERGWHPVSIDLSPLAGRRTLIAFEGEVGVRTPVSIDMQEPQAVGPAKPYTLEVKRVRGAFARPRITQHKLEDRRLSARRSRPSVVVVNVETFRADAPACYGGREGITPALDRLAAEGLRVENCVTAAPWTSPSVASLFTGLYPQSHGVTSYARSQLAESVATLAERASDAGVTTAAFCSNELISASRGFDQGFETFFMAPYANARQIVRSFEDWLEDNRELQFLAYLHLFEPHHPYNAPGEDLDRYVPDELRRVDADLALQRLKDRLLKGDSIRPDEPDVRLLRSLYLGEVRYLDRQLERLLAALKRQALDQRVVLIVTGDHGEEFLEHGLLGHGSNVYAESVRVPLVFWGPGVVPAGEHRLGPVEGASLFATILELMEVPYDADLVRPAFRFDAPDQNQSAYSSTVQGIRSIQNDATGTWIQFRSIHALRNRRGSLIYWPAVGATTGTLEPARQGLYDLKQDPDEQLDLSALRPDLLVEMRKLMEQAHTIALQQRHGREVNEIDLETRRAMGELGYLGGNTADQGERLFPPKEPGGDGD